MMAREINTQDLIVCHPSGGMSAKIVAESEVGEDVRDYWRSNQE